MSSRANLIRMLLGERPVRNVNPSTDTEGMRERLYREKDLRLDNQISKRKQRKALGKKGKRR